MASPSEIGPHPPNPHLWMYHPSTIHWTCCLCPAQASKDVMLALPDALVRFGTVAELELEQQLMDAAEAMVRSPI